MDPVKVGHIDYDMKTPSIRLSQQSSQFASKHGQATDAILHSLGLRQQLSRLREASSRLGYHVLKTQEPTRPGPGNPGNRLKHPQWPLANLKAASLVKATCFGGTQTSQSSCKAHSVPLVQKGRENIMGCSWYPKVRRNCCQHQTCSPHSGSRLLHQWALTQSAGFRPK